MRVVLITSMIAISCCHREREVVDIELKPYVKEFDVWLKSHCIDGYTIDSIAFVPTMDDSHIGVCWMYDPPIGWLDLSPREVKINREWWVWATIPRRKGVVFHELAHCRLGVDHEKEGLMAPSLPFYDDEWLKADMDAFLVYLDSKGMVNCWPERVKR